MIGQYSRYERNQDDSVLHVSHEANYEVFYEPFYVSLDTTPPHDERFLGYGFTRNSQVFLFHSCFNLFQNHNSIHQTNIENE